MHVQVNGKPREVPERTTVAGLLRLLGTQVKTVAVERNRAIVPRAAHDGALLEEGDAIEVVTFVGGG